VTDGHGADAGRDQATAPSGSWPCQRARRLAYDLVRELSIYQLAAERLRWTAPEHAYRLEVALMDVRRQVADIEVYLQVRAVALARMQLPAFDRLVRRAQRRRRRRPVQDYEAVRGRLSPGGRYHETVFPGEAAQALDDDEPDVRDEETTARLGRAIHSAVASAGAVHPARLGRLVRDVIDRHVTVGEVEPPAPSPGRPGDAGRVTTRPDPDAQTQEEFHDHGH
jgi:hypothetical protein